MPAVSHPDYLVFKRALTGANVAVNALHVSRNILLTALSDVPAESRSSTSLDSLYGRVMDVELFNVTVARARSSLVEAEFELASMAIPYSIAILGEYMAAVARLFALAGKPKAGNLMLGRLRSHLRRMCGINLGPDNEGLLDVVQECRNQIIHAGGEGSQRLIDLWGALRPQARARWTRVAKRTFPLAPPGVRAHLGAQEVRASFAVCRQYGNALNLVSAKQLPKEVWADVLVADYRTESLKFSTKPAALAFVVNDLQTLAITRYGPVGLTRADLAAAVGRAS